MRRESAVGQVDREVCYLETLILCPSGRTWTRHTKIPAWLYAELLSAT